VLGNTVSWAANPRRTVELMVLHSSTATILPRTGRSPSRRTAKDHRPARARHGTNPRVGVLATNLTAILTRLFHFKRQRLLVGPDPLTAAPIDPQGRPLLARGLTWQLLRA
jgi:hypothetical protein